MSYVLKCVLKFSRGQDRPLPTKTTISLQLFLTGSSLVSIQASNLHDGVRLPILTSCTFYQDLPGHLRPSSCTILSSSAKARFLSQTSLHAPPLVFSVYFSGGNIKINKMERKFHSTRTPSSQRFIMSPLSFVFPIAYICLARNQNKPQTPAPQTTLQSLSSKSLQL